MSDSAKLVLWLGLFMICATIYLRWSEISAVIFNGGVAGGSSSVGTSPVKAGKNHSCPAGYVYDSSSQKCVPFPVITQPTGVM